MSDSDAIWVACEEPERPADDDMVYHLVFDKPCAACRMKADAEMRQSGENIRRLLGEEGDVTE